MSNEAKYGIGIENVCDNRCFCLITYEGMDHFG